MMNKRYLLLRAPDGTEGGQGNGSGGGGSWLDSLPEDLRKEPSLATVPDVGTLAKNYVNAQKLIGHKRLEEPDESWDDAKWGEFWGKLGRPEAPDKYVVPETAKLPEGSDWDKEVLSEAMKQFHGLGLTNKQAGGILDWYAKHITGSAEKQASSLTQAKEAAVNKLREEWGANYEHNMEISKAAIRKFASPEWAAELERLGLDNNPEMVKVFATIGRNMMEDSSGGKSPGLPVSNAAAAATEISKLRQDPEFLKALTNRQHPAHKDALERWNGLFKTAFPGKEEPR